MTLHTAKSNFLLHVGKNAGNLHMKQITIINVVALYIYCTKSALAPTKTINRMNPNRKHLLTKLWKSPSSSTSY